MPKKKHLALPLFRRLIPQILIQFIAIIATAVGSNMFMTWFIRDVMDVRNTLVGAAYESIGTALMIVVILVSTNTFVYRRRLREVTTLSDAIERVSDGDFNTRITFKQSDPMASVYEDFNKMSAELASVQMLRNDFINSYSHEFKTPIASINGFASLLLEKNLPEQTRQEYLTIIRDESERLSRLTRNTILLSKLSSQQIVADTEEYDLGEQLRQCSIILSKSWLDKRIEFSGEFPYTPYIGSKELMQHLWLNLLSNAVKYTPEGGEITAQIYTRAESGEIVVVIEDTGIGMEEETLKHLFEPYYQGDVSHSSPGLGLGLSIAKRITELCGGSIAVRSKPGEGSAFTVTLQGKKPEPTPGSLPAALELDELRKTILDKTGLAEMGRKMAEAQHGDKEQ